MSHLPKPPGFFKTVLILLGASRKRSTGRRQRQQELLRSRAGRDSTDWSGLGFLFTVLLMVFINVGAAFVLKMAVDAGERIEAERHGKTVVSFLFLDEVKNAETKVEDAQGNEPAWGTPKQFDDFFNSSLYHSEARRIAANYGGEQLAIEKKLRQSVHDHGARNLVSEDEVSPGVLGLLQAGPLTAMLGSVVLIWWLLMVVFQGEGLELDVQRRRHPMWEFLFSHPVPPGAIFVSEMLSPIAANPIYWCAPLFVATVYGFVYGAELAMVAAVLVGIPVTISAACLGKALEIAVTLRFPSRTRGAVIGFMGWMGYASMMLLFVGLFAVPRIVAALGSRLDYATALPWPWLKLFLGGRSDGSFSFLAGVITCWIGATAVVASAVWFSVWATQQGLSGNFAADSVPAANSGTKFGKDPLYRKELLWFMRDRSAIVQTILIPLTVAGLQSFNLRGLLSRAEGTWNYLCGAAILFGTYFLWILGPKSLSSEGSALWIALTWPRGMESLLKAKAWLWSLISSAMVALVLGYAAFVFPNDIWKIMLVGVGWFVFARSMAEKAVTLVSVTSSSGEKEPIPWTRRWATQLGMLTFSIGILTQQWALAVVGIVYSHMTAAAMWQNFRARLPYLYDPWSEKLPPPPTLMHAMIAISILIEGGAVLTGVVVAIAGRENAAAALAVSYAISAVIVAIGVSQFLSERDVPSEAVWHWRSGADELKPWWRLRGAHALRFFQVLCFGAGAGILLAICAHAYIALLQHFPAAAELIRKSQEQMARVPNLRISYGLMAVFVAPFAEEYLFRGLLYRALDREWGGWRAVLGSAAFFAIYHPALSWFPVALLGATNAWLFKKTGKLAPAVVVHMVYNAFVLF